MLPRRKNNQSLFNVAVAKHWDNDRICSILVLWELNNIMAGRAMFQSRKINARLENAFEMLLLRQVVSADKIISSMLEIVSFQLIVSCLFDWILVFL